MEALVLEMPAAVENTLVFRLACDDVVLFPRALEEAGDALDAHVVALGGAAGEDDLLWVGADEIGNVCPGILDSLVCFPAVGVCARVGVAVQAGHEGKHGVDDAGVHGGRGLHVHVDGARALVHDGRLLQDAWRSQHRGHAAAGGAGRGLPAVGLIMASADMPVVGMVASWALSPVLLRNDSRSALMVESMLTVALDGLVSET